MEFDKTRVYTVANANEVSVGCEGYFADTLEDLRRGVEKGKGRFGKIDKIENDDYACRYHRYNDIGHWAIFYLVNEPAYEYESYDDNAIIW